MKCPKCQTEYDGESCPNCSASAKVKKKKPLLKRWWLWVIVAFIVVLTIGAFSEEEAPSDTAVQSTQDTSTSSTTEEAQKYEKVTIAKLHSDLEDNALRAKDTYLNKYVEFDAVIDEIDNDGDYMYVRAVWSDEYSKTVTCGLSEKHLKYLIEKNTGEIVTIKGQITVVGEFLGYTVEVDYVGDRVVQTAEQ